MQGGAEGSDKTHVTSGHEIFLGEDRGDLITFSHAVIDAGADVVFGHGPHVMRGMEFYKGRLIAYSLGNFCGYRVLGTAGFLGVGGVLKVTLHKGRHLGRREAGADRDDQQRACAAPDATSARSTSWPACPRTDFPRATAADASRRPTATIAAPAAS